MELKMKLGKIFWFKKIFCISKFNRRAKKIERKNLNWILPGSVCCRKLFSCSIRSTQRAFNSQITSTNTTTTGTAATTSRFNSWLQFLPKPKAPLTPPILANKLLSPIQSSDFVSRQQPTRLVSRWITTFTRCCKSTAKIILSKRIYCATIWSCTTTTIIIIAQFRTSTGTDLEFLTHTHTYLQKFSFFGLIIFKLISDSGFLHIYCR